ncbi:MAG: 1-acyl-sn-glycerol-3-phosphate acyltransferase [Microbacteriaceae bacterium]|jgi:1-acyl-sn-glycerol-3-phosphate acyltransferase|nr:1-acyl-sn-glycerol-3-phosphate acyltransferase [Microbacteriaceae bacterium]
MFYWVMKHLIAGPVLKTLLRPRVHGRAHIPRTGPVIVASNHLSFIDPVILPLVMRRRIAFLAASNYFAGRGVAAWVRGRFLRATGMIPIDRSGGKASQASLVAGRAVLDRGAVLGIYPEGSRSRDGKLHRGRTGVARLALESGAVVVPAAMIGTDRVIPVGSRSILPRIRRIAITFGPPLDFSAEAGNQGDLAVLRTVTDRIMEAIREVSGQEYVDSYSSGRSGRADPAGTAVE